MPDEFQYDALLSHSSDDGAVARPLAEKLRASEPGGWSDRWEAAMAEAAKRKTASEIQPFSLQPLLGIPLNKERRFIPLRLEDAEYN